MKRRVKIFIAIVLSFSSIIASFYLFNNFSEQNDYTVATIINKNVFSFSNIEIAKINNAVIDVDELSSEQFNDEEKALIKDAIQTEPDHLTFLEPTEQKEAFLVFMHEDMGNQINTIMEIFSVSEGKRIDKKLNSVVVSKTDLSMSDEQFIEQIEAHENVKMVAKNEIFTVKLDMTPNDPNYPNVSGQWELQNMNMSAVWELANGSGVTIGVFDVGFAQAYGYQAEFNSERLLPLVNYAPSGDTTCYTGHRHGTQVLSIAGAVDTNNGIGMASIAHAAKFQPYLSGFNCVGNSFEMSYDDYGKVFSHAINNGVDIINMSFGEAVENAVVNEQMQRALDAGLLLIAARGNSSSTDAFYPACSPGVLSVGALNVANQLASFSTYSDCGTGNYITTYGQNITTTSYPNNLPMVSKGNGTSFAAPIVAGVLGLMKSIAPAATNLELIQILKDTANDLGDVGYDQRYGFGAINPLAALEMVCETFGEVTGQVLVEYVDENNVRLLADETLEGVVNTPYTTDAKMIEEYQLIMIPDNAKGIFLNELQTVTYVYKKAPISQNEVNLLNMLEKLINNDVLISEEIVDYSEATNSEDIYIIFINGDIDFYTTTENIYQDCEGLGILYNLKLLFVAKDDNISHEDFIALMENNPAIEFITINEKITVVLDEL